jgi:hypothetical protein
MKCFGYIKNNTDELQELTEVTLQANSEDIRRLASFLIRCADEMDHNPDWEHEHLSDYSVSENDKADIVVFKDDS